MFEPVPGQHILLPRSRGLNLEWHRVRLCRVAEDRFSRHSPNCLWLPSRGTVDVEHGGQMLSRLRAPRIVRSCSQSVLRIAVFGTQPEAGPHAHV